MVAVLSIVMSALLLAGCAGSRQAIEPSGPTPSSPIQSSPTPSAAAPSAPTPSAPGPSGSAGAFTICPTSPQGQTCPLSPGLFTAAVHDAFSFSIAEDGWQEEQAAAREFETRIVLSRVDDPRQRVTFLSGQTGPAARPLIDPAAFDIAGFTVGPPTDASISGVSGQSVNIEPAGTQASSVTIEGQTVQLEPDRRYRITLARIPMIEESATVIMVTEAPLDLFATFVTMSDRVLQTVEF